MSSSKPIVITSSLFTVFFLFGMLTWICSKNGYISTWIFSAMFLVSLLGSIYCFILTVAANSLRITTSEQGISFRTISWIVKNSKKDTGLFDLMIAFGRSQICIFKQIELVSSWEKTVILACERNMLVVYLDGKVIVMPLFICYDAKIISTLYTKAMNLTDLLSSCTSFRGKKLNDIYNDLGQEGVLSLIQSDESLDQHTRSLLTNVTTVYSAIFHLPARPVQWSMKRIVQLCSMSLASIFIIIVWLYLTINVLHKIFLNIN